jgi:hypothetical protein
MKGHDPEGRLGPRKPLPDTVTIFDPPVDKLISEPVSEQKGPADITQATQAIPEQYEDQQAEDPGYGEEQPAF